MACSCATTYGAISTRVCGAPDFHASFDLRETGSQLSGTAIFPNGAGVIEDGKISADQLSFATRHAAQLTGLPMLTRFSGTLADGGLKLTMLSEGGKSYLTLNPVSR